MVGCNRIAWIVFLPLHRTHHFAQADIEEDGSEAENKLCSLAFFIKDGGRRCFFLWKRFNQTVRNAETG